MLDPVESFRRDRCARTMAPARAVRAGPDGRDVSRTRSPGAGRQGVPSRRTRRPVPARTPRSRGAQETSGVISRCSRWPRSCRPGTRSRQLARSSWPARARLMGLDLSRSQDVASSRRPRSAAVRGYRQTEPEPRPGSGAPSRSAEEPPGGRDAATPGEHGQPAGRAIPVGGRRWWRRARAGRAGRGRQRACPSANGATWGIASR